MRAILTAVAITVVGIALLVYAPNAILTKVHSVGRSTRVALATTLFFVVLIALAWALRRLQRRGVI
ncbi:MAG TPA: hypothetical protein VFR41_04205 [Acidimicrobiia bacterium]|nr:hypothetical protein [Acidimicrobiia bacterium]